MKYKINNLLISCKNIVFLSFIISSLSACKYRGDYSSISNDKNCKYGIVSNKSKSNVFLSPFDAKRIEWCVAFDYAYDDEITRNLYLNMNIGDTVCFYNNSSDGTVLQYGDSGFWIVPSKAEYTKGSTKITYFIKAINGIEIDKLPNLAKPEKTSSDIKLLERHGVDWPKKERPVLVFPKSDLTRFFETMDKMDSIKGYQNLTKKPEKTKSFAEVFGRHGVDWPKKERPVLVFPKSDLTRFFETMDKMDSIKGYQR